MSGIMIYLIVILSFWWLVLIILLPIGLIQKYNIINNTKRMNRTQDILFKKIRKKRKEQDER